jgi:hypothetical protein
VLGKQERWVRAFVYDTIGRKGPFVLFFKDLKFSQPLALVYGVGSFTFENAVIRFEVYDDKTVLTSSDQKALVSLVVNALDKFC